VSTKPITTDVWRELSARTIFLHQAIADHLGLNLTDHKCLDVLIQRGSMTAGKLAEASGLTTGAITGVVDRLEKAGFVSRTADDTDRRKTVIVVLPGRLGEIGRLFHELSRRTEALMASYTPKERAAINDFAHKTGSLIETFVRKLKE
jgi:DNA-binding MarR family transcriptional regulator